MKQTFKVTVIKTLPSRLRLSKQMTVFVCEEWNKWLTLFVFVLDVSAREYCSKLLSLTERQKTSSSTLTWKFSTWNQNLKRGHIFWRKETGLQIKHRDYASRYWESSMRLLAKSKRKLNNAVSAFLTAFFNCLGDFWRLFGSSCSAVPSDGDVWVSSFSPESTALWTSSWSPKLTASNEGDICIDSSPVSTAASSGGAIWEFSVSPESAVCNDNREACAWLTARKSLRNSCHTFSCQTKLKIQLLNPNSGNSLQDQKFDCFSLT